MRVVAAEELPAGAARLLTAEDLLVLCRDRDDQDDDQVTILCTYTYCLAQILSWLDNTPVVWAIHELTVSLGSFEGREVAAMHKALL